jgi:tocopherol O-methyltransferase
VGVSTCICLFPDRQRLTRKVARFWNQISPLWEDLWGPHIHHGYYEDGAAFSAVEAQERLLDRLVELAKLVAGQRILDVGCGMGGSSLYLSNHLGGCVTGISLSSRQISMAGEKAGSLARGRVEFLVEDALAMDSLPDQGFDVVWSLESCEQFFDKPAFLREAHRVLRPGGKLVLATWCSGQEVLEGPMAKDYITLCAAFDLPYMPTMHFYVTALEAQGFELKETEDWSENVAKTWAVGVTFSKQLSLFKLVTKGGIRAVTFVRQLRLMEKAYSSGMVKYGVFLANK